MRISWQSGLVVEGPITGGEVTLLNQKHYIKVIRQQSQG